MIPGDQVFKLGHLFVNPKTSQTHKRILFYVLVVSFFVDPRPKVTRGGCIAGFSVHERSHGLHPFMRARLSRAFIEGLRCRFEIVSLVIFEISERVIEPPILRISLDTALDKVYGSFHVPRAVWWWLGEEDGSEFVGRNEVRIQSHRYVKQGSKRLVLLSAGLMLSSEVLDDSGPVDIRQESGVPETELLHSLRRRDE